MQHQLRLVCVSCLLSAFTTTACMKHSDAPPDQQEAAPAVVEDPSVVATPALAPAPAPSANVDRHGTRLVYHLNLSMRVDEPIAALEQAEEVVREMGGTIAYASGNAENASLNARVDPKSRDELRKALAEAIEGRVESENLSSSDVGTEFRRLRKRSHALDSADNAIAGLSTQHRDPQSVEALTLLRELTANERRNIAAQLQSYEQQLSGAQVNVSFQKRK